MLFAIALAALPLAAIAIHDFLTGESFLGDRWRAMQVRRANLVALDRAAAQAGRSNILVSMTTIPSRLAHLETTLKSLLLQSRLPAEIRINLPHVCRREDRGYEVPEWLSGLSMISIRRCDDLGPATKFLPTLQDMPADQPVLVVDDDRIYPSCLVETLEKAARQKPDKALATSGWIVPGDLTDRRTNYSRIFSKPPAPILGTMTRRWRAVDIIKGTGGYLVRPEFFDLTQLADTSRAPPEAFYADDIWLSGHCRVEKFVVPARQADFAPRWLAATFRATSLGRQDEDKRRNTATLRYFDSRSWRVGGPLNPS